MSELLLIGVLLLLLIASVCDLRSREIPDWVAVGTVLAALVAAAAGWAGIRFWMVVAGGLLGLMIGAGLFKFANLGGGDAKLIAAVGALLGPFGLLIVLFWMAVSGGVLALIAMLRGQRDYAYVPAIAAGYLAYLIWPVCLFQR